MRQTKTKTPEIIDGSINGLLIAANEGDESVIAELRKRITSPEAQSLVDKYGDMAHQVERALLKNKLPDQEGSQILVAEKLRRMRIELGWHEASAIERILIDRVTLTWLALHFEESTDANARSVPLVLSKHHQFRIDRAQRRHLAAVKMLATVRKMALPLLIDIRANVTVNGTKTTESKSLLGDRFAINNSKN